MLRRWRLASLFLITLTAGGRAQPVFDMEAYLFSHCYQTEEAFLEAFPYDSLLPLRPEIDLREWEAQAIALEAANRPVDLFHLFLADRFYTRFGEQLDISSLITGGTLFAIYRSNHHPELGEILPYIGSFFLNEAARRIEKELKAGRLQPDQAPCDRWIRQLARHRVYLSSGSSRWDKLWSSIKEQRYGYILERLQMEVRSAFGQLEQLNRLSLQPMEEYPHSQLAIILEDRRPIGHAIRMRAGSTFTLYESHQNQGDLDTEGLLAATTGGFVNAEGLPEGLTLQNGQLLNARLLPNRHGVVIVDPGGGLRVFHLGEAIELAPDQPELLPLERLSDYARLLRWCQQERQTVFQTQLLIFDNNYLPDLGQIANQYRERRLLARIEDPEGTPYFYLFDFPGAHQLGILSLELFLSLNAAGFRLDYLLNLDVGGHNYLQVFDGQGRVLEEPAGTLPPEKAANVLFFYGKGG